jgi:hypothetical protein
MTLSQSSTTPSPWSNPGFALIDLFNIPIGFVEGAMAAIQSNTNNYYCSMNSTAARNNMQNMFQYIQVNDINNAVNQLYLGLQKVDNIVINCGNSIINATIPNLFVGTGNTYFGQQFVMNILYNVGFQFTDILNLIFINPAMTQPFWYFVFYTIGDFLIRFLYRSNN